MDGIILVDKPKDYTSRDIVNIVGKCLNTKKVGHTGTLDPLATGVLAIAINKGLKIASLLTSDTKEYIASVQMGVLTDTLDTCGKVLKENANVNVSREILLAILNSFLGEYEQEVPRYSAVKVNGKRLYDYARNNEEVALPKRMVNIYEIELLDFNGDYFKFRTLVSKGTYIRSLIRDIGTKLDVYCTMSDLRRIKQGIFSIDKCHSLNDIKEGNFDIVPMKEALSNYKIVEVDEGLKKKIGNGMVLDNVYNSNIVVFINRQDQVLAIYKKYDKDITKIKPLHVLEVNSES